MVTSGMAVQFSLVDGKGGELIIVLHNGLIRTSAESDCTDALLALAKIVILSSGLCMSFF